MIRKFFITLLLCVAIHTPAYSATGLLGEYLDSDIIADNATYSFLVTGKTGFGQVVTSDKVAVVQFIFYTDGTFIAPYSSGITTTKDNAGTINMYTEGGDIIIQNKTGAAITIYHNLRRGS